MDKTIEKERGNVAKPGPSTNLNVGRAKAVKKRNRRRLYTRKLRKSDAPKNMSSELVSFGKESTEKVKSSLGSDNALSLEKISHNVSSTITESLHSSQSAQIKVPKSPSTTSRPVSGSDSDDSDPSTTKPRRGLMEVQKKLNFNDKA